MSGAKVDHPPVDAVLPRDEQLSRAVAGRDPNPEEEDGPLDLQLDEAGLKRARVPDVRWPAEDSESPDYAHLVPAGREPTMGDHEFDFAAGDLDLLIGANAFEPRGYDDTIVFALRGARLVGRDRAEEVDRIRLEELRPDHRSFRCTIGFYNLRSRKLWAYRASTVPNVKYMTNYYQWKNKLGGNSSISANMLPTGCYVYRVGAHKNGTIKPALRLTDPENLTEDGTVTVLRTFNDLTFKTDDLWDECEPYDNVHCAYADDSFSSAGCLTICGENGKGPWGRFQHVLGTMKNNARLDVVLLTGREASMAAYIRQTGRATDEAVMRSLRRLRPGSRGEAVKRLQQRLGMVPTGYFGSSTKKALIEHQARAGVRLDGIYAEPLDAAFGWDVMQAAPAPGPVASANDNAPQPAATPAPIPAPGAVPRPEPVTRAGAPAPAARRDGLPAPAIVPSPQRPVLTAATLNSFAARAHPQYREALLGGTGILTKYGIDETPLRFCHFLGQIGNECGRLTILEENMNYRSVERLQAVWPKRFPTRASAASYVGNPKALADKVYGGRLGNDRPGDGYLFRGRGFVQITGRGSYREMGRKLGIPLEQNPDLAFHPEHALKIACETWASKQQPGERDMNRLSDANKLEALTYRINGGYTNIEDRRAAFEEAWAIWASGSPPKRTLEADVFDRGDRGDRVDELNSRLAELDLFDGITSEPPQHVFTLSTYRAVRKFQEQQRLQPTGVATAETAAALDRALEQGAARAPVRRSRPPEPQHRPDYYEAIRRWTWFTTALGIVFATVHIAASKTPAMFARISLLLPLIFAGIAVVCGLLTFFAVAEAEEGALATAPPRPARDRRQQVMPEEEPVRQGLNTDN